VAGTVALDGKPEFPVSDREGQYIRQHRGQERDRTTRSPGSQDKENLVSFSLRGTLGPCNR
jgi:hypothetical protein